MGKHPVEEGFFSSWSSGLGRRAVCARMSERAFGTRLESEAVELEQGCLLTCQIQALVNALVGALSLPVVGEENNNLTWGW